MLWVNGYGKHIHLYQTIVKIHNMVLPYFIAKLPFTSSRKKIMWKTSGLQKYSVFSHLFCEINSNFTIFLVAELWWMTHKLITTSRTQPPKTQHTQDDEGLLVRTSNFGLTRRTQVNKGQFWHEQPKSAVQNPKLVNSKDTNIFSMCKLD